MKKRILIVNLILIMMMMLNIFKFTPDVKKKLDRKNDSKDE